MALDNMSYYIQATGHRHVFEQCNEAKNVGQDVGRIGRLCATL